MNDRTGNLLVDRVEIFAGTPFLFDECLPAGNIQIILSLLMISARWALLMGISWPLI
jgi:hypothetical protein